MQKIISSYQMSETDFDVQSYLVEMNRNIVELFNTEPNKSQLYDLLLDDYIQEHRDVIDTSKKLKQIQMKIGTVWQMAIGGYHNFRNLDINDRSGLDVISENRKIILEIKNRYNTDNKSSKITNMNKLARFKIENPEYTAIYGVINCNTEDGKCEILENGVTYLSGKRFLEYIFQKNTQKIVEGLKTSVNIILDVSYTDKIVDDDVIDDTEIIEDHEVINDDAVIGQAVVTRTKLTCLGNNYSEAQSIHMC